MNQQMNRFIDSLGGFVLIVIFVVFLAMIVDKLKPTPQSAEDTRFSTWPVPIKGSNFYSIVTDNKTDRSFLVHPNGHMVEITK